MIRVLLAEDQAMFRTAACAEGADTAEVALRICLSEGTIRNKISEILLKLGARNRAEAVRIAEESGWM